MTAAAVAATDEGAASSFRQYLCKICMPLLEWVCIAGFPILLCIQIAGLPAMLGGGPAKGTDETDGANVLQWAILLSMIASVLSLGSILLLGDTQDDGCANRSSSKRGIGIVMGSHLAPLLYIAMLLSLTDGGRVISCQEDVTDEYGEVCKERNYPTMRGFEHLRFASLGGLAFAMSCCWIQLSECHRKFNRRRNSSTDQNECHAHRNGSTKKEHVVSSSSSVMTVCCRSYVLLLMVLQSGRWTTAASAANHSDACNPYMLALFHIALMALFDRNSQAARNKDEASMATWQDAFTPGEWMAVSTLVTSLVGEYVLEYSNVLHGSLQEAGMPQPDNTLPSHVIVAHAGLVGCLVGVTFYSISEHLAKRYLRRFSSHVEADVSTTLRLIASLGSVAGITLGCLEVALRASILDDSKAYRESDFASSRFRLVPSSVKWMVNFLSSEAGVAVCSGFRCASRAKVLGYWASVLGFCLPLASMLIPWIKVGDENKGMHAQQNVNVRDEELISERQRKRNKKRVIIARKYFHLVAILLFAPITLIDPDMMAISYAIAIALLVFLEMLRCQRVRDETGCKAGTGRSSLWKEFYMVFLDEKDSSAAKGGLAVTHIALILGCAVPLWASQLLQQSSRADRCSPLPFLGVLVLGVGDSVGAIVGVSFGRQRWPGGSSRTLEGSVFMFLSMAFFVLFTKAGVDHRQTNGMQIQGVVTVGGVMTIIEASTSQIDNLCLPLAGTTLLLLICSV